MDQLAIDLRFACRNLVRRPGFALVAIATLALGIGATTAMFTVLHGVVLQPLPYSHPERLVRLWESRQADSRDMVNPLNFVDWRESSTTLKDMTAFTYSDRTVGGAGDAERIVAGRVTPGFFTLLGVEPAIGRGFVDADGAPEGPPVVVLGHAFWQRHFEGRSDALGGSLIIEGTPHEIVGIATAEFAAPIADQPPAIFVPLRIQQRWGRGGHWLRVVARLNASESVDTAQTEMNVIASTLEASYPSSNSGRSVFVEPLHEAIIGTTGRSLAVLACAVSLVLLLACSNVAHLLLGRAVGRQREIAVRRALGAARQRLARQLLTESSLLAVLGAGAGLLLTVWLVESLVLLGGDAIPRSAEIAVTAPVLFFAGGLAILTATLFGWAPILIGRRDRPFAALRDSGGGDHRRAGRMRSALVIAEIGVAVVMLLGAGVLLKSFARLTATPSGVEADGVTVVEVALPSWQYADRATIANFYRQLLPVVRNAPDVEAAGAVNNIAFMWHSCDGFELDDRPPPDAGDEPCADNQLVTPGYFRAAGISLLAGRDFDHRDHAEGPPVIVINETMARRFWPHDDALGHHVTYNAIRREIVGVIADVRRHGLASTPDSEMFIPHAQEAWETQMLVTVRGSRDAAAIVRSAVLAIDPSVPTGQVWQLDDLVGKTVAAPRFRTVLFGVFAAVALILAVVGLYGLMSFAVAARTRELGIRMALGARRLEVIRMIVKEGSMLTGAGLAVGVAAAAGLLRVLDHLLFETAPFDPVVFTLVPVLFGVVALAAAYVPAARASRLDPTITLRHE